MVKRLLLKQKMEKPLLKKSKKISISFRLINIMGRKGKLKLLRKYLFLLVVALGVIRLTHEILYAIYGNEHYHMFLM